MRVLVAAAAVLFSTSHAIRLTPEMMTATNQEEFLRASSRVESPSSPSNRKLQTEESKPVLADSFDNQPGFYHGVASGDPLPYAIVLWTRYTPVSIDETVRVEMRMAQVEDPESPVDTLLDPATNTEMRRAFVDVTSDSDFTVKIDVTGLPSNSHFVYAFLAEGSTSQVGQTRTAPAEDSDVEEMTYAFFTCSDYARGFFHAFDIASTMKDLDFWVHVGDYIYEFGYFEYSDDVAVPDRISSLIPQWEASSLQDYRTRYSTNHIDEALQNIRRRAPLIAIWDDHEVADNCYSDGSDSGALGHQEMCPATPFSTDEEKDEASCDRDEGDITERIRAAAQVFLEWLPLRTAPSSSGIIDFGSITQIIEWGSLATIAAVDTRFSHRSAEPTLSNPPWFPFFPTVQTFRDVSQYNNESSDAYAAINQVAEGINAFLEREDLTMLGDNKQILQDSFSESKAAGKPWQIWAGSVSLGRIVTGDFTRLPEFVDPSIAPVIQGFVNAFIGTDPAASLRAWAASAYTGIPFNSDDYGGFVAEQRQLLALLKEHTNNPIVLGGDLHDTYGWTLFEGGGKDGEPCAVNLICPAVTSDGIGTALDPIFSIIGPSVGGGEVLLDAVEQLELDTNPGLEYFKVQFRGFIAVKVTKTAHTAEVYGISKETLGTNYADARSANSNGLTAAYFCDSQLVTTAGMPGSIDPKEECGAIEFDTTNRPAAWSLPVPVNSETDNVQVLTECGLTQCSCTCEVESEEAPPDDSSSNDLYTFSSKFMLIFSFAAAILNL